MGFRKSRALGLAMVARLLLASPPQSAAQSINGPVESYSSSIEAEARHIGKDFRPDGNLSKQVWKRAKWVAFSHDKSGSHNLPSAATRVAAAWTADFVYFAFWCKYDSLNVYEGENISRERWELWNRDVAEVFLNPQPENISHYYEFEVAPNNQWIDLEIEKKKDPFNDASWDSGFEHATSINAGKHVWSLELRIPLVALKVNSIRPGTIWRVNFFRAAGPGEDKNRMFLAWSTIPNGESFHVPSRFGILRFIQ